MRIILSVSLIICFLTGVYSQKAAHLVKPGDTLNKDPFINTVEQSLRLFLTDYVNKNEYDSIIKALNYEPDHIPQFTDEQYCEHIKKLNETTPFKFECNQATLSTIKFFVSDVLMKIIDRAVQVHGALGISDDTLLSFWYRHERGARIYDGPDEVHKSVLARKILQKYAS
jgi:hypothetical protein